MQIISELDIKSLFPKNKNIKIHVNLDKINFETLTYFTWFIERKNLMFFITEYNNELVGIEFEVMRFSKNLFKANFCSFCEKQYFHSEIVFVSTKVRNKPKNVNYMTRGNYICEDCERCSKNMKNRENMDSFIKLIIG